MDCCGSYTYIFKLTLEIQILRVLANTPTGYGYTQKWIKKSKITFSHCNEDLFKYKLTRIFLFLVLL